MQPCARRQRHCSRPEFLHERKLYGAGGSDDGDGDGLRSRLERQRLVERYSVQPHSHVAGRDCRIRERRPVFGSARGFHEYHAADSRAIPTARTAISYIYTIKNTSGGANNVTSAQILIPWQDTSAADGNDGTCPTNGCIWYLTTSGETPAIVGRAGYTHCAVTAFSSATSGSANGSITIGNSGGVCTITPGGYINVEWSMKGPYKVNDSYKFPTCINGTFNAGGTCGGTNAAETWTGDQTIQIVLGASLVVTVAPSVNANGYAFAYVCPLCTLTQATNTIQFPNIAAGASASGTDLALLDVYTDASNPVGWTVYVTQQNPGNPTAAQYLQTQVDATSGSGCPTGNSCISYQPVAGTSYGTTSYTAIPVTTTPQNGLVIGTTPGTAATRKPFEFSNDYQVVIPGGGNTAPSISTVTYTFISN